MSEPVRVMDTTGESEPWVICPDYATPPGADHKKECPRASWNKSKYAPKEKK